jgi:O-antigen ligase
MARQVPASLAPVLNGSNMLLLLLLFAWFIQAFREQRPFFRPLPHTKLVMVWMVLSCFSAVTTVIHTGGFGFLLGEVGLEFKAWIDQFLLFFAFVNLIRDGTMARRLVVYMMLGSLATLTLGFQEMLDKQGLSTIERSRVEGPQIQPNDFGAFLVYSMGPFLGLLLTYPWNWRCGIILPYLAIAVKVLVATFSRGAYLALVAAGLLATYTKGLRILLVFAVVGGLGLALFPQVFPESAMARLFQTQTTDLGTTTQFDASSQVRLVLWNAAIAMTLESPIFGKGFKMFPQLKDQYTEIFVHESDNHNMYLYISSQMGIPALITFVWIFYRMYQMSKRVAKAAPDGFGQVIGLGGVATAVSVGVVNIFGSRMVGIEVCGYVWIYLAVIIHLFHELNNTPEQEVKHI